MSYSLQLHVVDIINHKETSLKARGVKVVFEADKLASFCSKRFEFETSKIFDKNQIYLE